MPVRTGDALVDAVYDHRLADVADTVATAPSGTTEERELARRAVATCERIGASLEREARELRTRLDEAGVPIDGIEPIGRRQNHTITFLVAGADVAARAIDAVALLGFEPWERWEGAAFESFRHSADQMTAGRTTDMTLVVRFRWNPRRRRSIIDRTLTPTAGDWDMVTLPAWAWRGYPVVRLLRLGLERIGLRPRHLATLGPFISTPDDLLEPLVHHVDLDATDLLVDLGCGDGRVLVAAAELTGCHARGVERDVELVRQAEQRVDDAGVSGRVTVIRGDARSTDIGDANAVFVFLPPAVLADLLPDLLARMRSGAKLVAHEQTRLPADLHPAPTESDIVIGDEAITVAHRWVV